MCGDDERYAVICRVACLQPDVPAVDDIGIEGRDLVFDGRAKRAFVCRDLRVVELVEGHDAARMRREAGKVEVECVGAAGIEIDGVQTYAVHVELGEHFVFGHDDAHLVALSHECAGDVDGIDPAA